MIKNFAELVDRLLKDPVKSRVAVVAAQDLHTLEAVLRAYKENLIAPVLIGNRQGIETILKEEGIDPKGTEIIAIDDPSECAKKACELARAGKVDAIMKGHLDTKTLMKVLVNKEYGISCSKVMNILAFMESPHYHKLFTITDVGLLTYPTKEQKQMALQNAVAAYRNLGEKNPKIAVLSAMEKVNPKLPQTIEAEEIKKEGIPGAIVEGPISLDLAMDKEACAIKGYESPIAGDADILLVPDIVAGNLAAKSLTVLGGCKTGGVVVGGLVPVILVSRAATVTDKYLAIVMAAMTSKKAN
ncbi:MAG: phosphate butyryltransferase [Acidaminococcus sp.]|jgi:phosphotransacetylase|nr:phosphate butyryltransferase [Acidaminococcus sp.]MCI2099622.1 phosphate butyryltransferase [Acidaminococcus sp.]MCI2113707.1 phosphate butyryltransferase [Acidaminococcus sp.]MCI2115790.1 phosphate butyryltransferase [Acidaminococcus sp.]